MLNLLRTISKLLLVPVIILSSIYYSLSNSIKEETIRESIKKELLTGFIYDDNGNKTEIFNTILRLTKLSEDVIIRLMENDTANDIITDVVDSIYDYNLTGDSNYKYTREKIIDIVETNIDKVLTEIEYYITNEERTEAINYTRNNTDYILDVIYSTDIGDYKKW